MKNLMHVLALLYLSTYSGAIIAGEFNYRWHGSSLVIDSSISGSYSWKVSLESGPVCASGTSNTSRVEISKIAFDKPLLFTVYEPLESGVVEKSFKINPVDRRNRSNRVFGPQVVYQLPVRTYLAKGIGAERAGKLSYLTNEKIEKIKSIGVDFVWLTGVIEQASYVNTDPDVVKGDAGSYYAIRDFWDVNSQIGDLNQFFSTVDRIHDNGLRVIVDLVVNHSARITKTDVSCKSHLDFGRTDDKNKFFDNQNNYFYLRDTTFIPPYIETPGSDGVFDTDIELYGIQLESPSKVTGNNVESPRPGKSDWFETAKLNYGFEFNTGYTDYEPTPKTWKQMVDVAKYWLNLGVDGFRVDFAHTVPLEFWEYFVEEVREFHPSAFLIAEAYLDGMGAPGFGYDQLYRVGFDSVYNSKLYWSLHDLAKGGGRGRNASYNSSFPGSVEGRLRGDIYTNYLENHDELRLASRFFSKAPSDKKRLYGLGLSKYAALLPGHFLIHGGQEVGEAAEVFGPFAGDSGKTSIFDYVYQAETLKFFKGQLPEQQLDLRNQYASLFELKKSIEINDAGNDTIIDLSERLFYGGDGRVHGYIRKTGEGIFLVVANFDPLHSKEVSIHFTTENNNDSYGVLSRLGIVNNDERYIFEELTHKSGWIPNDPNVPGRGIPGKVLYRANGIPSGLHLGSIDSGETFVFKVTKI